MIISPENRAVFTEQLRHRRGGRPRLAVPTIPVSVRIPEPLFDACCRIAARSGQSVPDVVRAAVQEFMYQTTGAGGRTW